MYQRKVSNFQLGITWKATCQKLSLERIDVNTTFRTQSQIRATPEVKSPALLAGSNMIGKHGSEMNQPVFLAVHLRRNIPSFLFTINKCNIVTYLLKSYTQKLSELSFEPLAPMTSIRDLSEISRGGGGGGNFKFGFGN